MTARFHDENALRTYLGRDQTAFQRSPEGPKLQNAKLFGKLRPAGVHENTVLQEAVEKGDRDEYVTVAQKYPAAPEPFCADGKLHRSELEITANITAEFRSETRVEPDSETLIRFGIVSRRLLTIEKQPNGRTLVQVIEWYFGDQGERYAAPVLDQKGAMVVPGVGAIVALYPLTTTGMELLRHSHEADRASKKKLGARLNLTTFDRLVGMVRNPGSDERVEALARAKLEAEMLLAEACARWNALCPPSGRWYRTVNGAP